MISLGLIRSDSAPATGAMNIGASVHGQDPQPRAERRVALHRLEELRQQEDRAEHPEEHQERRGVREREATRAEEAHRQHRRTARGAPRRRTPATQRRRRPRASRRSRARPSPGRSRGRGPRRSRTGRRSRARRPGRSRLPAGPRLSSSRRSASGTSTRPIGTFSQKIHCQAMPSTTAPPTSGPNAIARPPIPPQAPSASPRFSGGTAALSSVRVSGITIAPPSPCTARASVQRLDRRRERGARPTRA